MAEPARVVPRWLAAFERDPTTALDALLRGIADVAPYERAEAVDVLLMLFGGLSEEHPHRQALDEAMAAWLDARRQDGPEVRREYGMSRYVDELTQALTALYRLPLPATAGRLRRDLPSFLVWLQSLYSRPGRDPAGALWRAMALTQRDRSLIEEWYRLCEGAGDSLPDHYVDIGLLGLQHLPLAESGELAGGLEPEVLAGLFRWAARLPAGPAARRAFQRRVATLMVLYPRAPKRWREVAFPLLNAYPEAPFQDWLQGAGLKPGRGATPRRRAIPALPPRRRRDDLLRRVDREWTGGMLPEIWALVREYERYAEATGEVEFVVKTALNFSGRLRRLVPREALRLARLAHRWGPSNPYAWTQWAGALEALGEVERAEVVYWEAVRRFPENEVTRNALADLLAKTGRLEEAEDLFRETMSRFPGDEVARSALADFLGKTGRLEKAEELFRETMRRFPGNEVVRNALADLLAKTGRDEEAEALYRETIERFPRGRVAPHALAFWLLRWDRVDEAQDLYLEIRSSFQESNYSRRLAEEITKRQEGGEGEVEVPDFSPEGSPGGVEDSARQMIEPARTAGGEGQMRGGGGEATLDGGDNRESQLREEGAEPLPNREDEKGGGELPVGVADGGLAAADAIAEQTTVYFVSDEEALRSQLDLPPRLVSNAAVSRADLRLRSGENGAVRRQALATVEEVLAADPEPVYPRLVLALHDVNRRPQLVAEAEAFPHAYPLRFLAARVAEKADAWNRLLSDFGEHRPFTLLGRVLSGNGAADPVDAARLGAWVGEQNGSRRGFVAFTAERLRGWLGEAPGEAAASELLHRLTSHREAIEALLGDALRWTADEGVGSTL
jgi:pentatricopeptide repeat protein